MKVWSWLAIAALAAMLLLAACDDDGANGDASPPLPTATAPAGGGGPTEPIDAGAAFQPLAGTYEGAWTNETFQTTAELTIDIAIEGAAATFTLTVAEGPEGSPFGVPAPEPKVLQGTVAGRELRVELLGDDFFGDMTALIAVDGAIAASATMDGVAGVSGLAVDGTIGEDGMDLRYTVTFPDATEAGGSAVLTK